MRLVRIYATLVRVLASYLWLRLRRPFLSDERYETRLSARHTRNARRIERAIIRAGGLFIKVGQLISILTNFLPEEFRRELEGLQDQLPPRPYHEIAARLRAEFGQGPDELFASFDRAPIATASLAQVHVATLADGRRVAVKAQHADIERMAAQDLETIRRILHIVQLFTGVRGLESYHPEIKQMIAEELDFTKEAENIRTIGSHFTGDTTVRVPTVVPERSTRRVLTTEYVTGTKITDFAELEARGVQRRRLAERVVTAYCRMIFVDGIYHADPHPGNILVATDGAIVFLDFGAVGVLSPAMKKGIPEFFEGVIRRNSAQITEAIRTMGFVARNPGASDVAERVIAYVQHRFLEQTTDASWGLGSMQVDMRTRLEALADLRRLDVSFRKLTTTFQVPRDWVLLERTLLLLVGLCTELDPNWNPMAVIRPYLENAVLGNDRNWGEMLGGSLKEMAITAATLPENLQRALVRANRGELEVRVPEITRAARLLYAGMQQMIFGALATGCGVIAYSAYENRHERVAAGTLFLAAVLLTAMFGSMLGSRRYRV